MKVFYRESLGVNSCEQLPCKLTISVNEKFLWLLDRFSRDEIKILEQSDYVSDDEYLRGIEGMIQIIQAARNESIEQSLSLDELDW
jgi:hypothetical protein